MGIKQICLAISLPVIAFLSLYWIRQRKKNDKSAIDAQKVDLSDQVDKSTVVKRSINQSSDQSVYESGDVTDELNNTTALDKSTRTICKEFIQPKKSIAENSNQHNSNDDKSTLNKSTLEKSKCNNESIGEQSICDKSDLSIEERSVLTKSNFSGPKSIEPSTQFDESTIEKSFESINQSDNRSSTALTSNLSATHSNDISNLNNNESDFKSKLDQQNIDLKKLNNQPTGLSVSSTLCETNSFVLTSEKILDNTLNESKKSDIILDVNENSKFSGDLVLSTASLMEGEEMFEANAKSNSTLNSESLQVTDQFVSTLESKENTFNTANDSSLNATINTSIATIDSNSTLNLENCSSKTLRSHGTNSFAKKEEDLLNENSNVQTSGEVRENYLNDLSMNSTVHKVGDKSTHANSIVDIEKNCEEKFLNLTEHEFKNDSKIEAANAIVEEITNKVAEELEVDLKKTDTIDAFELTGELDCSIKSEKSEVRNELNNVSERSVELDCSSKSEEDDDSILVIYDGPQTTDIKKEKKQKANSNAKSTSSNQTTESPTKSDANLDESDDLEIVYDNTNSKPKVNVQHTNHNHGTIENQRQASNEDDSNVVSEYCFEIPRALCGLLIGTKGSFINNAMKKSNTLILIRDHPTILDVSLCLIKGRQRDINEAIGIIKQRFPPRKFPQLTLAPINSNLINVETMPQNSNLVLAEGVNVDVLLSNFETPGHVFLQQPTHPTFNLLQRLNDYLISTYEFNETPAIEEPPLGIICAVQQDGGWYRAIVTSIDVDTCVVRLLDYGGLFTVPKTSLRQVKRDYMSVPFQSVECFLSNIQPINGVWSRESIDYFKQITQKQFLQAYIINYTPERIPLIFLYRVVDNQLILINNELCMQGYAMWIEYTPKSL